MTAADGTTKDVTFTINGTNDAAVIGDPAVVTITEDANVDASGNLLATGTLAINDADTGEASFRTTVTGVSDPWGTLTLAANGSYSYAVSNSDARVQALNAGETHVDTFTVSAIDGTTKTVNFTINGVNEPIVNRAPVAVGDGLTPTALGEVQSLAPTISVAIGQAIPIDVQFLSAGLRNGGHVVVCLLADGDGYGVYGQRFDVDGNATGDMFRANTTIAGQQALQNITSLADGGFIVSWSSYGQDGSGYGVYAQRYGADGSAMGTEFRINSTVTGDQSGSSLASLSDGGFVASWVMSDGNGSGIYAQRFNASGQKVGSEFLVNSYTTSDQNDPQIVWPEVRWFCCDLGFLWARRKHLRHLCAALQCEWGARWLRIQGSFPVMDGTI